MNESVSDTDLLLEQAAQGDENARNQLLDKHRNRLRAMVAMRLDRRVAARIDPSDVIQESLAEAAGQLSVYLRDRPVPFYLWLRQIAWQRLIMLHRRHLHAGKRSVNREERDLALLSDQSILHLAERLLARGSSPSARLRQKEQHEQIQVALLQLKENDREVIVLRYLEQLSISDIAILLGISEGAVKVRQLRAVERLRGIIHQENEDKP